MSNASNWVVRKDPKCGACKPPTECLMVERFAFNRLVKVFARWIAEHKVKIALYNCGLTITSVLEL